LRPNTSHTPLANEKHINLSSHITTEVDTYKLKFTILQLEIFRLLCVKTGQQLNQRQIAKHLNVSPTAVAKALPLLEKEQIVKIDRGLTNAVQLNRDSQKTVELKRAENLRLLYESGLPEFIEESYPGCTIILFGSYARGDDTTRSDIDIAVIGTKEKDIDLSEYEKRLEKPIRINYYENLKRINTHLKSNLCNGIVLAGGIEL